MALVAMPLDGINRSGLGFKHLDVLAFSLRGGSMIGCGIGSSCDEVLNSRWATVGGILPISVLATGAYLAMLTAVFFIGPARASFIRQLAWGTLLILSGTAAGSAVWFTILQKWTIGAFCPYCITTHLIGLLLALLVIWQIPKQFSDNSNRDNADDAPTDSR